MTTQMILKEVDLSFRRRGQGASSCEHPDIDKEKQYLVKIHGSYFVGRFHRVWFGWTFSPWHLGSYQLDGIEAVWEVIEFPRS